MKEEQYSKRTEKGGLLFDGEIRIENWCAANNIAPPKVEIHWDGRCDFGVCAYYRDGAIDIWPNMCAAVGMAGRQWSYPGYVVDRTPYGVLAHELGHHVDHAHGPRGGTRSHTWRVIDPSPLTGYCPNDNEWFAELFRLFVTNPDLLRLVRPRIYRTFASAFKSVETRPWREVLAGAERQIKAAENKIAKAAPRPEKAAPAVSCPCCETDGPHEETDGDCACVEDCPNS